MKTKTLVGRIFTLTNHKKMPFECDTYLLTRNLQQSIGRYVNKEKLGDAIMIYDESTKKVKIGAKNGQLVWISKAYLKQAVEQIIESPAGEMQTLIDELTDISYKTTDSSAAKNINNLLTKARTILSFIENINKIG